MISLWLTAALLSPECDVERPQVWLFSDLGTNGQIWRLPEGGGLADALEAEGLRVFDRPLHRYSAASAETDLVPAVREAHETCRGARTYAVGLGLGGTVAAEVAARLGFDRVVLVGAPLAFGGSPRAAKALFAVDRTTSWEEVAKLGLQGPTTRRSLAELLLTHGLPRRLHEPFRERALMPIQVETLRALRTLDRGAVPTPNAAFAAIQATPALEVLVVTSMADGLFPAWQCDPAALGLRRANIERLYFTRANDSAREYNHLDLLLSPSALGEVHPRIIDWITRPHDGAATVAP